ncbi:MAG: putative (diheme) protein [Verrucomicrobiaceae bacterium]|nr:putative (diheme) protein [Verrucomicrobiaceae bacterium]
MSCHRLFLFVFTLVLSGAARAVEPFGQDLALLTEGAYVYERNCMICHGASGDGNGEWSKGLMPKPRSFREGMFKFRTTPFGMLPTDADLQRTIRGGLSGTAMGMFTVLGNDELRAVVEYVKSFSRRWRKLENYGEPMHFEAVPPWMSEASARDAHVAPGKILYNNACAVCHGAQADGNGPSAPLLTDIWKLPSKPSDLRQEHLRCGDRPADIYRILATGMNGTPMISYDATLTPEQRWDIIAFILSVRVPSAPVLGGRTGG